MRLPWLGLVLLAGCPERSAPPLGTVEQAACAFAGDAAGPVLATVVDRDVILVDEDGAPRTVYTFGAGRELTWISPVIQARDGFLLVSARFGDATAVGMETALFTTDGVPLWVSHDGPGAEQVFLGAAGQVAITGWATGTRVLAPDGTERGIIDLYAMSGPLADGTVPARRIGWGSFGWGWSPPDGGPVLEPAFTSDDNDVRFAGDRAIYLTTTETGTRLLVDESRERLRTTALPLLADEFMYMVSVNPGWVLLQDGASNLPLVLVDLARGEATRLAITLPEGHRVFNYTQWDAPRVDDRGALLLAIRDDVEGGLFRSMDRGINWHRVGASVSDVLGITPEARSGTYVVAATSVLYSWEEWPETPGADLVGDSVQLVRPASGVSEVISVFTQLRASISDDGACVAMWDEGGLFAVDAQTGTRHELGVGTGPVTWIYNR